MWLMVLGLQSFVVGFIASLFAVLHFLLNVGVPYQRDRLLLWLRVALPSSINRRSIWFSLFDTLQDSNALFTPNDAPGWNFQRFPVVDLAGLFHFETGFTQIHEI